MAARPDEGPTQPCPHDRPYSHSAQPLSTRNSSDLHTLDGMDPLREAQSAVPTLAAPPAPPQHPHQHAHSHAHPRQHAHPRHRSGDHRAQNANGVSATSVAMNMGNGAGNGNGAAMGSGQSRAAPGGAFDGPRSPPGSKSGISKRCRFSADHSSRHVSRAVQILPPRRLPGRESLSFLAFRRSHHHTDAVQVLCQGASRRRAERERGVLRQG